MIKNYLFTIAIENSFNHDYITEKLWQPLALAAGSIPLYYGAPNVDEWLPCENYIIDLRKFANPREAAEFIMSVANNATLYAEFHKWRNQPMPAKFKKIVDYFERTKSHPIDCIVCEMAHNANSQLARHKILDEIGPVFRYKESLFTMFRLWINYFR